MSGKHRQRAVVRALALAFVLVLSALAVTACGSSDESDAGTTPAATTGGGDGAAKLTAARATADVEAAREPLGTFSGPTEPAGPAPSGKEIVSIFSAPAPLPQRAAGSVARAAAAVGWKVRVVDGAGSPKGWAEAVDTAITGKADGIVLAGGEPPLIAPQVARAQEERIPFLSDPGCVEELPPGVTAQVRPQEYEEGYLLGELVVSESPDGAEILALDSPEFVCLQQATAGFKQAIADAGPKFEIVEEAKSPVTDITTPAGAQRISALLRKHPDVTYFWVLSESWAGPFTQAAQQIGNREVKGLGTDGDFFVPMIQRGANFAMVGPDTEQYGWYAVDALIRAFNGKPQVDYELPYRLVDATNADTLRGPAIASDHDYAADWTALWK